jgi:hypothetical protein
MSAEPLPLDEPTGVPLDLRDPSLSFAFAAEFLDPTPFANPKMQSYRMHWGLWAKECIDWSGEQISPITGCGLTPYQFEILEALPIKRKVAVRGPHGLGKTTIAALALLAFVITRDGEDWKAITTASVWRQLIRFLWPEIRKWARKILWQKVGRPAFNERRELFALELRLSTGSAFAAASDVPEKLEGAHAKHLLYIIDEGKIVPDKAFDAIEGAFSGAGADTIDEAFALCISTPGSQVGRFHEIHSRRPGFEDWWTRHVTLEEAILAGRISREWAEQRARQWGVDSPIYQNRVLGEFAKDAEDGLIPLSWVEAAVDRHEEARLAVMKIGKPLTCLGVDVARSGADKSVIAQRHGRVITELYEDHGADTMALTGKTSAKLAQHGRTGYACVDVIGVGAGVVDRLREQGFDVEAFNASTKTDEMDLSGEFGFVNRRSAAWYGMRQLLDPANHYDIALPPSDMLIGDLTAPRWRVTSTGGGRIAVESKEDYKRRLGRSPDHGDAVCMAFAERMADAGDTLVTYYDPVVISPF